MRKIIPLAFGIIIVLSAVYIVKLSSGKPDKDILEIGTFVVLTLTLIVLVFYAYNTNLLASIGQLRWESYLICQFWWLQALLIVQGH